MSTSTKTNRRFCHVPWSSIFISPDGFVRPCSQNFNVKVPIKNLINGINSEPFLKLRQEFRSETLPQSCQRCFDKEQIGSTSHRMRYEKYLTDSSLGKKINTSTNKFSNLLRIDLSITNSCNLSCRTCDPYASSLWAKKLKKYKKEHGDIPDLFSKKNFNHFSNFNADISEVINLISEYKNTLRLNLQGGEPMVSKSSIDLLKRLVDSGDSERIDLSFITNGTVYHDSIKNILNKFHSVRVYVSVDGDRQINRLIRGVDLEKIEENLEAFSASQFLAGITFTLSAYNALFLVEFLIWYNKILKLYPQIELIISALARPAPLSIQQLPRNKIENEILRLKECQQHKADEFIRILEASLPFCIENEAESLLLRYDKQITDVLEPE